MNLKAQIEIVPLIMAIAGAVIGWVMASRMGEGIIYRIVATLICGAVCYFLSKFIADQ